MGYFDLKKQLATKQTSTGTSSKSGYFALKQKVAPTIASLGEIKRKKAQEDRIKMLNENTARLAQEAEKAGSVWGIAKETAKGVGKTLLGFGKEVLRFPVTAPLKVVQSLTEAATGKPQVYTPQTGVEKFVYGDARQSYQQDQAGVSKWTQEKGLGKGASTAIGAGVAGAEVLADLALPGMASKIFKSAIGKSILSKMGVKSAKVAEAVSKGTTTEKEIVDIFEEKGLKGVEEVIAEPTVLKAGELAPIVKEIEATTGVKLKPSEALQVKADLEKGISKEAIINDIVEPPTRTTMPVEPPKVTKPTTTPKEPHLIQEARKYKSAEEFVTSKKPKDLSNQIADAKKFKNAEEYEKAVNSDPILAYRAGYRTIGEAKNELRNLGRETEIPKLEKMGEVSTSENTMKILEDLGVKTDKDFWRYANTHEQKLTDIWNKSQPLQEGDPLIQEARKYESAEELLRKNGIREDKIQNSIQHIKNVVGDTNVDEITRRKSIGYLSQENMNPSTRRAYELLTGDKLPKTQKASGEFLRKKFGITEPTSDWATPGQVKKFFNENPGKEVYLDKTKRDWMAGRKTSIINNTPVKIVEIDGNRVVYRRGNGEFSAHIDQIRDITDKKGNSLIGKITKYGEDEKVSNSIWNQSQPLQEGAEKVAKIEPKIPEKGKSITAEKMNKRFADDKKMATEYDVIEINKKLDDATKRLQENPEKAISEAFSEGGSNVDRVATLTELFEKSIKDGDEFMQKQAFNKLKQLAPETAQTMNMFKALTEANPHFSYMSSVVDLKLKNLVLSSSNLRKATKGMKPAEALNKAKKMAKEKISKDILNTKSKITIKKAQDLLDNLLCK